MSVIPVPVTAHWRFLLLLCEDTDRNVCDTGDRHFLLLWRGQRHILDDGMKDAAFVVNIQTHGQIIQRGG